MRPFRIVVRTFAKTRTSCGVAVEYDDVGRQAGRKPPRAPAPELAAGTVVSIARICADASPARCRYTNSSVGS